jgi:quinol monooxygenase YgiN
MAVWEIAQLTVAGDAHDQFQAIVRSQLPGLQQADGCQDVKLLRAADKNNTYLLCIRWQTIEHHTEAFVKTGTFTRFSDAIALFLTEQPAVFHAATVINGFDREGTSLTGAAHVARPPAVAASEKPLPGAGHRTPSHEGVTSNGGAARGAARPSTAPGQTCWLHRWTQARPLFPQSPLQGGRHPPVRGSGRRAVRRHLP